MSRRSWVIIIVAGVVLAQLLVAGFLIQSQKHTITTRADHPNLTGS